MINSRLLSDLLPHVAAKAARMIEMANDELPIDKLIITSTYRDYESQNALYAQGRTKPGDIVTNARGGYSWHNFQVAFDVVPVINGVAIWNNNILWRDIGEIGKECDLEWGGDWQFVDKPHFQDAGGLSMAQLRAQKVNQ